MDGQLEWQTDNICALIYGYGYVLMVVPGRTSKFKLWADDRCNQRAVMEQSARNHD